LDNKQLMNRLKPFQPKGLSAEKLALIWPLIKDRIEHLSQIKDLTEYFVKLPKVDQPAILKESKLDASATADYLSKVIKVIDKVSSWTVKAIEKDLHDLQVSTGLKPRPAFMTIRLAATGRSATPPLFDTLYVLGKDQVIKHLTHAQKTLQKK